MLGRRKGGETLGRENVPQAGEELQGANLRGELSGVVKARGLVQLGVRQGGCIKQT